MLFDENDVLYLFHFKFQGYAANFTLLLLSKALTLGISLPPPLWNQPTQKIDMEHEESCVYPRLSLCTVVVISSYTFPWKQTFERFIDRIFFTNEARDGDWRINYFSADNCLQNISIAIYILRMLLSSSNNKITNRHNHEETVANPNIFSFTKDRLQRQLTVYSRLQRNS